MTTASTTRKRPRTIIVLPATLVVLVCLCAASVMVGVADSSWQVLIISRLPRTIAIILTGATLSVAGLIMQLLSRNRFVEPATVGTTQSASLGLVLTAIFWPGAGIGMKMTIASLTALIGTGLFLSAIAKVRNPGGFTVPLIGIMLGAVIGSVTTFLAMNMDLLQSLAAWHIGSFAGVLKGRYELLWLIGILVAVSFFAADRFTLIGLGRNYATNAGINAQATERFGLLVVAVTAAVTVTVIGAIPFLGLIVPNIVSLIFGDNTRRTLPWVALFGAVLCLACDLIGRLIRFPYEMPVATVLGVIGAIIFLTMLFKRNRHVRS